MNFLSYAQGQFYWATQCLKMDMVGIDRRNLEAVRTAIPNPMASILHANYTYSTILNEGNGSFCLLDSTAKYPWNEGTISHATLNTYSMPIEIVNKCDEEITD